MGALGVVARIGGLGVVAGFSLHTKIAFPHTKVVLLHNKVALSRIKVAC
jgi:hypothetical protein